MSILKSLEVQRLPLRLESDYRRVITRYFDLASETRPAHIAQRVASLDEAEVEHVFAQVLQKFHGRHDDITAVFEEHFRTVRPMIGELGEMSRTRRMLIGSYFTMEYSIASAALFNPSIVPHPRQENLPAGAVRFLMSLRATGEGHVSSIVFRSGVISADHSVTMDPPGRYAHRVRAVPDKQYEKRLFCRKLQEIAVDAATMHAVMDRLGDYFTLAQLEKALSEDQSEFEAAQHTRESILSLAQSNYELQLAAGAEIDEVVIFPLSSNERHGIEDLRLVRFVDDEQVEDRVVYYGTYTAYDGHRTLPQLMDTRDFHRIGMHTLNGAHAKNKGLALFPRRIGGHYVMCARVDGENLYLMTSDIVHFWETAELLCGPQRPWEFVQIGNCGSPLETPAGWLLLTHGVGPMRTYAIGAMLLDRDDPSRVLGQLETPLITPTEEERDGYVPNIVYTCGSMIHAGYVYIPFSTSDQITRFATVSLDELLERLVP
jgi:predicted GH43/DUF377 family glycosyl hydrolase